MLKFYYFLLIIGAMVIIHSIDRICETILKTRLMEKLSTEEIKEIARKEGEKEK